MDTKTKSYYFFNIYGLADLIERAVRNGADFEFFDEKLVINAYVKFSRCTLLHIYIKSIAMAYYSKDFRKNGDLVAEDEIEEWNNLCKIYKIQKLSKFKLNDEDFDAGNWFCKNEKKFFELFSNMAEEVFFILFNNRDFLLKFNKIVSEIDIKIPNKFLTKKGTIKRINIPQWVKRAVYYRDRGRCVFCNKDLTGLVNHFNNSNYDHIVPLDLLGANDPCNIQLACESCNKKKSNRISKTTNSYIPWW